MTVCTRVLHRACRRVSDRPVADIGGADDSEADQPHEARMLKYQCCFCAAGIDQPHLEGVRLSLTSMGSDPTAQDLFAHTRCLDQRFAPTLAPETVFDASVFEPE